MLDNSQIPNPKTCRFWSLSIWSLVIICNLVSGFFNLSYLYAQENKDKEPIIVNGDKVEYASDAREVTATGNVVVIYKDSKLTCDKLTVNTQTKDAIASGDVRLEDKRGIVQARMMQYNFETQTGKLIQAKIESAPYYGEGDIIKRISENKFEVKGGYMTTCDLDKPHYRIFSKIIEFYRGEKVKSNNNIVYVGGVPVLYLPEYTHSLKDPLMHVQLMPGRKKDWGTYMLSAWRYNLTDNVRGRIYLDYRERLGLAEGFGLNYDTENFGKGDYKYYYTQERPRKLPEGTAAEFQRYLIRWRHMWNINPRTKATLEYYKITDSKRAVLGSQYNFLKDYFYREYEKDEQPKSYFLINHAFNYASLNLIMQKRINRWYDHITQVPDEKLPEVSFDLPSYKIDNSPLYLKNKMVFSNLNNKNAVSSSSTQDLSVSRFDTYNQLSWPTKLFFIWTNPYIGARQTLYNKDVNGSSLWKSPRTVFYSGLEMSAKFYRIFNLKSDFLGMDINDFRHIITPTVKYAYIHEPTIVSSKLKQFDAIDSITRSNKVILELENKLQTKDSDKKTIDFATLRVTTEYDFKPKGGTGSSFSDFLFDLELIPYAWLRVESDATYDHLQDNFRTINLDAYAILGNERSFGIGHRYERKGGKELTSELNWRLNPKWKFRIYERYQFAGVRKKGLKEQEYTISRDLHCWTMDLACNVSKDSGTTIWLVFRLKAFPEVEFGLNQSYHKPKDSSESQ